MKKLPSHITHIVGIDEVGRGPLAGPVTLCMVIVPVKFNKKIFTKVTDSKLMKERAREAWYTKALELKKELALDFRIAHISNKVIDSKGISHAIKKALKQILKGVDPKTTYIYLDGSLHAPSKFTYQETIIKGDQKVKVISAASVIAKVCRDTLMKNMAQRYPLYGFEKHKGYGTRSHRECIKLYGLSEIHRVSFCRNIVAFL